MDVTATETPVLPLGPISVRRSLTRNPSRRATRAVGFVAIALAMTSWVGFALTTRAIAHSEFTVIDVQAIRYVVPALLLLPWWRRAWREVRRSSLRGCGLIAVGGGVPFFLLSALGGLWSTAGHITIMNLGVPPILVALVAANRGTVTLTPARRWAMALIAAGVTVLAFGTPHGGSGVLVLLLSAALWTIYTLAQERARLAPTTVVLLISVPSAVVAAALAAPDLHHLLTAPDDQLAVFLATQGIGSGIVATVAYSVAIRRLGASLTTLIGATTPVLVATMSAVVLREYLTGLAILGLALVVAGAVRMSVVDRRGSPARQTNTVVEVMPGKVTR